MCAYLALFSGVAQAQHREPLPATPDIATAEEGQEGERWFVQREEIELAELLDAFASIQGLPLDYDRSAVKGRISLRTATGLTSEELWSLVNRWLAASGQACIQASGESSLSIVPLTAAAKLARVERGGVAASRAGFVKVIEPVSEVDPAKAAEALLKVLTAEGSLVQVVGTSILVAGQKPLVQEALELLWALDRMPAETAVETVPIAHLPPTAIVALIERIKAAIATVGEDDLRGTLLANPSSSQVIVVAPEREMARWRSLVERFDVAEEVVTRNYAPRRFGLRETAELVEAVVRGPLDAAPAAGSWRLVEDELTETLVVTAPHSKHAEIEALLERVETAEADPRRAMRAFPVKHRRVDEMVRLLEELLANAPLPASDAPPEPAPAAAPVEAMLVKEEPEGRVGGRPPRQPTKLDLSLGMDEGTNRILAIGPPRSLDDLGKLIEQLDVREPQVLVETLIVTLSDSQTRDLAVELQKIGNSNGTLYRLASLFKAGSPDPATSTLPAASGTGFESVVLDPGSFSGVLRALETVNRGRTLTVPKVLVNNHETAHLDSVLQSPFATSNTSTNLATISFGGTLDAGTKVEVTPQITEGDQLLLDYSVALSTFVGDAADPTLPPPRQENKLASVASIPDGYAVVVGGLEVETKTDAESRVPFLGSIPLLGNLFKSRSRTDTKSRFYVFLRASVLRSADYEDLRYASAPAMALAGVTDDLPVVEPRVIR